MKRFVPYSPPITGIMAPLGESRDYCQIIVTCELVLLSEHESLQLFPCRASLQGHWTKAWKCLFVPIGVKDILLSVCSLVCYLALPGVHYCCHPDTKPFWKRLHSILADPQLPSGFSFLPVCGISTVISGFCIILQSQKTPVLKKGNNTVCQFNEKSPNKVGYNLIAQLTLGFFRI